MRALCLIVFLAACHAQAKPTIPTVTKTQVVLVVKHVTLNIPVLPVPKSCMAPAPVLPEPTLPTDADKLGNVVISAAKVDIINDWVSTYKIYVEEQFERCKDTSLPPYAIPEPEENPLMPEVPVLVGPFDSLPPDGQPPY
jgi:hypothetical protein